MKVYVLLKLHEYDCDETVGIFATLEGAKKAHEATINPDNYWETGEWEGKMFLSEYRERRQYKNVTHRIEEHEVQE